MVARESSWYYLLAFLTLTPTTTTTTTSPSPPSPRPQQQRPLQLYDQRATYQHTAGFTLRCTNASSTSPLLSSPFLPRGALEVNNNPSTLPCPECCSVDRVCRGVGVGRGGNSRTLWARFTISHVESNDRVCHLMGSDLG